MEWFFREKQRGEITRDPVVSEFFSIDAIKNPADALIREAIQNSLDERVDGENLRIRIGIVSGDNLPDKQQTLSWFDGIWEHLNAKNNGLRTVPSKKDPCPYLIFEDFGTKGLIGDITQSAEKDKRNSFFYFFRAEGRTGKSEKDRGRWGIGKHVFPRSSRINTYFGFTVRHDDNDQLLMGHTVLKTHSIDEKTYSPDGYLGKVEELSDFVLPISEPNILNQFKKDFWVSRTNGPGLSIVVPFLDSDITCENITEAVLSGYYYPILKGELTVFIETKEKKILIDKDTILEVANSLNRKSGNQIIPFIDFANWVVSDSIGQEHKLDLSKSEKPVWTDELIPSAIYPEVKKAYEDRKKLAFHINLRVPNEESKLRPSFFKVYLWNDGYESGAPTFIREGIIISDQRAPKSKSVRSIVVIEDKPLATLLGDSENPAHTQWQRDSSNFKNKYKNGKDYIAFVTNSVANLVRALGSQDEEEDPSLLIDIFSLPLEQKKDQPKNADDSSDDDSGGKTKKPTIPKAPREKRFRIDQQDGGFKIAPGNVPMTGSEMFNVQVAYHLRKGNPLKKYHPADFNLGKKPINYKKNLKGLDVEYVEKNEMKLRVTDPNFQIIVEGFDEKRDLYVKIQIVEGEDD